MFGFEVDTAYSISRFICYNVLAWIVIRIYTSLTTGWCKSSRRLDGKTVIITGANAGIGKETARDLARRGARVILACRSMERGNEAVRDIIATTGNSNVVMKQCDLSSLASVRSFCANINQSEERLDVLVLNAGLVPPPGLHLSADNYEMQFATNHLGHFLLVNLLTDLLKRTAPARIVVVSSILHHFGTIDFDNINFEKNCPEPFFTYSKTKLCNVLLAKELSRRLSGTGVTANVLHPGLVQTDINQSRPWYVQFFLYPPMTWIYGKTCLEGAQTTIYLSVAEEVAKISGKYFSDCAQAWSSRQSDDCALAARLWEVSAEMTKLEDSSHHKIRRGS